MKRITEEQITSADQMRIIIYTRCILLVKARGWGLISLVLLSQHLLLVSLLAQNTIRLVTEALNSFDSYSLMVTKINVLHVV